MREVVTDDVVEGCILYLSGAQLNDDPRVTRQCPLTKVRPFLCVARAGVVCVFVPLTAHPRKRALCVLEEWRVEKRSGNGPRSYVWKPRCLVTGPVGAFLEASWPHELDHAPMLTPEGLSHVHAFLAQQIRPRRG